MPERQVPYTIRIAAAQLKMLQRKMQSLHLLWDDLDRAGDRVGDEAFGVRTGMHLRDQAGVARRELHLRAQRHLHEPAAAVRLLRHHALRRIAVRGHDQPRLTRQVQEPQFVAGRQAGDVRGEEPLRRGDGLRVARRDQP